MRLRLCKKLRKIRDRITRKARRRNPPIDSAPRASSSSGIEASFSTPTSAQPEKPAVATGRNEQTKDDSTSQRAQKDNKDMVPASSEMATALKAAKEGISAMNPSSLAERGVAVVDQKKDLAQGLVSTAKSWGPMLSRVKKFTELVDKLVEVHPYAEMAWSILSIVQKTVIGQVELDRSIYDLLDTIQDVYEFVEEAGPLNDVLSARDVLVALAQQTTECGYFIRDYAKDKDFATRMASNVYKKVFKSDEAVPELVKDYRCNLKKLRSKLLDHATIRTEITVNRIWNAVKDIADNVRMGLLEEACAKGYWYNSEKKCLPRTRETILRIILDWIHDQDDSRRALVLSGPAGVGKSAIAHTIASIFDKNQHLGSCYFFDRNKDMLTNAQFLFPTIARDLSQRFPLMKTVLADVVARNSALLTSDDLAEQFRCLIAEPAKKLTIPGPIVIVVDALDECKESVEKFEQSAHRLLLSILSTKEEEGGLPANFRILVTCRFQPSIMATLGSNVRHESMTRILKNPDNAKDLRLYVHDKLSQSHAELQDFESICDRIVQWAEGIFQWAATAFRFIASSTGTQSIKQRMETIKPSREGEGQLDRLYMQVLRFGILSEQGNDTNLKNYQTVMRLILVPREPLSVSDLQDILYRQDDSDHREIVKRVVECMASLLSGSNNTEEVVRPYHSSFLDFVLDRKRSGKFCVEPGKEEHEAFARGTLRILLGKRLHFNMCKLKTSYRLNADIPGLGERVRANIPPSLVYSARYWADHLEKIAYDPDLQEMTEQFLKNKFLFWVEVLSLIESMVTCASALGILKEWIPKDVVAELEMGSIIKDFLRFIRAFGMTIGASAPHLYLSALAFAPASSKICQLYEARFSRRAIVECGRSEEWPALECTMEGHDDRVLCAEFSRNGKDVSVSYSYKGFTTRVWNAETGQPTRRPVHCDAGGSWASCAAFSSEKDLVAAGMNHGMILVYSSTKGQTIHTLRGHTKQVRSVAFSTDGKRVVSGSDDQKVCIWDVPSEQLVHLPLQRHTDKVTSVAFSPDSKCVASGSEDRTICLWNTETGQLVCEPLRGHSNTVNSVVFSHDSEWIASGSDDKTVRLWDTSGQPLGSPLEGHTDGVICVAISPDKRFIASGSSFGLIHLWNTTEHCLCATFRGHVQKLTSLAFSKDGQHIVSGSVDRTVRVWDVSGRRADMSIAGRHSERLGDMAMSPDGKSIVTWIDTCTDVCVWDVSTGTAAVQSQRLQGHEGMLCMEFSPDGRRVLSCSYDRTVRMWEVSTGQLIRAFRFSTGDDEGDFTCYPAAISQDGRFIAMAMDGPIWIMDVATETRVHTLQGHTRAMALKFSPDGKCIASSEFDQTIRLWDLETGQPRPACASLEGHTSFVFSVAFSRDGASLVSCDREGEIRIWDTATGQAICDPWRGHDGWIRSVVFSPNGRCVVSGGVDRTVRVWDAFTGRPFREPFQGHTHYVTGVAFSRDGKHVISCSWDCTIRFWDASTECSESDEGLEDDRAVLPQPHSVSFSPNRSHALADIQLIVPDAEEMSWFQLDDSFTLQGDGWLMGSDKRRLLWIPIQNRKLLWRTQNRRLVISPEEVTTLNLSNFAHGEKWAECFRQDAA